VIREGCGTVRGLLAHQAAREWPCGWCVHAEQAARLAGERMMPLPAAGPFPPVTVQEAAANAFLLDREVAEFERTHRQAPRRLWLRRVA
jgi:hypothetical protein